jgi:branched-chain amino acid transport system ATP-binding protein
MILVAEHLSISFGGVHAVEDVSLAVAPGLVFSIIGPNGAGKTTLFNLISGLYLPAQGRVRLAGEEVSSLAPEELARRGLVAHVPKPADLLPHDCARKCHGRPPSP